MTLIFTFLPLISYLPFHLLWQWLKNVCASSLISLFIVKETFDFLDELLDKLYYYFQNDRYYSIDYRMVVSKKTSTTAPEIIKLLFLCMNSKVIFDDLTEAHSVILTSGIFICFSYWLSLGTLSPLSTFEYELGCHFAYTLEAPHSIQSEQVYE